MKQIYHYLLPLALLSALPVHLNAQASVDANVGFGTAFNSANGAGIDNTSSSNPFGSCLTSAGDAFCQSTPGLGGLFMNLGGDIMFNRHVGVGAGFNFQPSKRDYGPLQYRQMFIDGDVLYKPISNKHWALVLQGGLGGARTGFSLSQSSCVGTAVCVNQSESIGTATHFQVNTGAGVEFLLADHLFFRPEFDLHYVPNFTDQFGRNAVPTMMFNIGYTSRSRD